MKLTTHVEYKVLVCWLINQKNFNPSTSTISKRTGVDRSNVSKILKSLVKKKIFKVTDFTKTNIGSSIKSYDLTESFVLAACANLSLSPQTKKNKNSVDTEQKKATYKDPNDAPHVFMEPEEYFKMAAERRKRLGQVEDPNGQQKADDLRRKALRELWGDPLAYKIEEDPCGDEYVDDFELFESEMLDNLPEEESVRSTERRYED